MITFKLFKNKSKVDGDNLPLYQNETISYKKDETTGDIIKTFQENVIFEKGKKYQVALYKNDDESLGVTIKENTYVNPKDEVKAEPVEETETVTTLKNQDDIPF